VRTSGLSNVGMVREINEDSFDMNEESGIYIVCDGMGGHEAGEQASQIAVSTLMDVISNYNVEKELLKFEDVETHFSMHQVILLAMQEANNRILLASTAAGQMGTTAVMAIKKNGLLYVGHIGDSRMYLVRDKQIKQITEDHSVVQQLVKAGVLSEGEAKTHPYKNVITRCLGIQLEVEPDIFSLPLEKNDRVIMCTDGLSNMVSKEEIKDTTINNNQPELVCQKLIETANKNGGIDNITAIVIYND